MLMLLLFIIAVLLATELDRKQSQQIESETGTVGEDERRRNSGEPCEEHSYHGGRVWTLVRILAKHLNQETHLKMASASKQLHCCKSLFALQRVLLRSGLSSDVAPNKALKRS
jgi:hypothetical protein